MARIVLTTTGVKNPKQWSADTWTSVGVEFSCLLGGAGYLFGTIVFAVSFPEKEGLDWYIAIALWETGSVFFTLAAVIVGYRHFSLGL